MAQQQRALLCLFLESLQCLRRQRACAGPACSLGWTRVGVLYPASLTVGRLSGRMGADKHGTSVQLADGRQVSCSGQGCAPHFHTRRLVPGFH